MNALIGLEDKSQLALSSSGIGLPQPGQQPRNPGPALLRGRSKRSGPLIPTACDRLFRLNVNDSEGFLARKDLKPLAS